LAGAVVRPNYPTIPGPGIIHNFRGPSRPLPFPHRAEGLDRSLLQNEVPENPDFPHLLEIEFLLRGADSVRQLVQKDPTVGIGIQAPLFPVLLDLAVIETILLVQDEVSGLYGQFYIESDTHTFTNGKAQMDLTLAFENLMDEEEIEKDTNNKKSK